MKQIALGSSQIEVSSLCLGTMYFGTRTDERTSFALLDQYWDAGGRFLDTANAYARWVPGGEGGESEALLGKWLRERGRGHEAFIATKVGFPTPADDLEFGLRPAQIERAIEASLERLSIEQIDLYYAHADDRTSPLPERLETFNRLRESGKIRLAGASNMMAWRLEEALWTARANNWAEYCCVQQRFSYLRLQRGSVYDPHVEANGSELDYCRNRGLGVLAYSPLLGGSYVRDDKPLPPDYVGADTDARLAVLGDLVSETGASAHQVVLAWMLQSDPPVIPIIGVSTKEQLAELLEAPALTLSTDQLEKLSDAGNRFAKHPNAHRFSVRGSKRG